jgi:hypothetical protein
MHRLRRRIAIGPSRHDPGPSVLFVRAPPRPHSREHRLNRTGVRSLLFWRARRDASALCQPLAVEGLDALVEALRAAGPGERRRPDRMVEARGAGPTATRPPGPRPGAPADGVPGSTRAAPSSPPRPSTGRLPGGASPSSATGPGGGRRPSPTRPPAPRQPPRPRGLSRARSGGGRADTSCAADQLEGHRRLGEAHRERKVVRGGAPSRPDQNACSMQAEPDPSGPASLFPAPRTVILPV